MSRSQSTMDPQLLLAQTGWIRALARSLLDESRAEEVAQEATIAALTTPIRDGHLENRARAWLGRVVRNLAVSRLRSDRSRRSREEEVAVQREVRTAWTPPEISERSEQIQLLVQSVVELREPYRTTLLLKYFDGLSTPEIAREMKATPVAVRKRVSRGLGLLREDLDRQSGGDGEAWKGALAPLLAGPGSGSGFPEPSSSDLGELGGGALAGAGKLLGIPLVLGVLFLGAVFLVRRPSEVAVLGRDGGGSKELQYSAAKEVAIGEETYVFFLEADLSLVGGDLIDRNVDLPVSLRMSATQEIELTPAGILRPSQRTSRPSVEAVVETRYVGQLPESIGPATSRLHTIDTTLTGGARPRENSPLRNVQEELSSFLPSAAPKAGEEWSISPESLGFLFHPRGRLEASAEETPPEPYAAAGISFWSPADWFDEISDGDCRAVSEGIRTVGGRGVESAKFFVDLSCRRELGGTLGSAGMEGTRIETDFSGTGRMLWDAESNLVSRIELSGRLNVSIFRELCEGSLSETASWWFSGPFRVSVDTQ